MIPKLGFLPTDDDYDGMAINQVDFNEMPFKSAIITIEPGATSPLDIHAVREYWVIVSGFGELEYDGAELVEVKLHDAFYFDSHKSHKLTNKSQEPLTLVSVWWDAA